MRYLNPALAALRRAHPDVKVQLFALFPAITDPPGRQRRGNRVKVNPADIKRHILLRMLSNERSDMPSKKTSPPITIQARLRIVAGAQVKIFC
jgi:hypothetical protein